MVSESVILVLSPLKSNDAHAASQDAGLDSLRMRYVPQAIKAVLVKTSEKFSPVVFRARSQ
jgi:hypothetical protein